MKLTFWVFSFLAIYYSPQFVETALPNKGLLDAIYCLRDYMGDITPQKKLSSGEYLGAFCEDESLDDLEERVKHDIKGAQSVKKCLDDREPAEIYEKYHNLGIQKVDEKEKEEEQAAANRIEDEDGNVSTNPSPPRSSTVNQAEDESDGDDNLNEEPSKDAKGQNTVSSKTSELDDQNATDSETDAQSKKDLDSSDEMKSLSDLSKFVIGICYAEEVIDFKEIKDPNDKTNALNCLQGCTERFVMRMEKTLSDGKQTVINFLTTKRDNVRKPGKGTNDDVEKIYLEEQKQIGEFNEQIKKFQEGVIIPNFTDEFDKIWQKKKPSDIDSITKLGKDYFFKYSKVYLELDQYLSNLEKAEDIDYDDMIKNQIRGKTSQAFNNIGNEDDDEQTFDDKIEATYFLYRNCAKRECAMKGPSSIPFYEDFLDSATDRDPTSLKGKVLPPKANKFFKVLTDKLKLEDDDYSNAESSKQVTS